MNKTSNCQLNQWARSDRVKMEDFNADNAKIDAAIKAVDTKANTKTDKTAHAALQKTVAEVSARAGSEVIASVTLTEESDQVRVDLSGLDWSKYSVVVCHFVPAANNQYNLPVGGNSATGPALTVLFPLKSQDTLLSGFTIYNTYQTYHFLRTTQISQTVSWVYSVYNGKGTFDPGTTLKIIGIH